MQLSVVIITFNEEANIGRTLKSVMTLVSDGKGEIIVVDSGSTDRTVEIAKSYGAKVFVEEWKGFAAQKNSAIDKATGSWILSLDADEEVEPELSAEILFILMPTEPQTLRQRARELKYLYGRETRREFEKIRKQVGSSDATLVFLTGYRVKRKNHFLGRWIKHGGFWPDSKLRLFKKGAARFENRLVHEDAQLLEGIAPCLQHALIHHSYPTISDYIEHMNRYSSLGAEMVRTKGKVRFTFFNITLRPLLTFVYNYIFRLGLLDGREGLLLHLNHAVYVAWKYGKAWELRREPRAGN